MNVGDIEVTPFFEKYEQTPENYWRSIILLGKNTASYKFAWAKTLNEFVKNNQTKFNMDEAAAVQMKFLCESRKRSYYQGVSEMINKAPVFTGIDQFHQGEINETALQSIIKREGFKDVVRAFPVVNNKPIDLHFYHDERKTSNSIVLTDEIFKCFEDAEMTKNIMESGNMRQRLFERACELRITPEGLINYDEDSGLLYEEQLNTRVNLTSCIPTLNSYQRDICFYCTSFISTDENSPDKAEIEHFIPMTMSKDFKKKHGNTYPYNLNAIWNLVLACKTCNNLANKGTKVPSSRFWVELNNRNNFLHGSYKPIQKTIEVMGGTPSKRLSFLEERRKEALEVLIHEWNSE